MSLPSSAMILVYKLVHPPPGRDQARRFARFDGAVAADPGRPWLGVAVVRHRGRGRGAARGLSHQRARRLQPARQRARHRRDLFPAVSARRLLFRGILFRWIEEFGGSWSALLLTSALFGAAHLATPMRALSQRRHRARGRGHAGRRLYADPRSLWLPMGLHAAWNFTQGECSTSRCRGSTVTGWSTRNCRGRRC